MIIRRILRIFGGTFGSIILVSLVLSVCLFYFGPMLGTDEWRPLDSYWQRGIVIGCLWGFSLFLIGLIFFLRRRRDRKMTQDIVGSVDMDPTEEALKSEMGDLREKMRTAMAQLRKSKMGRKHLYELPWYVMIGPPGAGKTTAIVNSGLKFPLADEMGKTPIGGVGGTRNCDWWFTDNAVLIDTAGRYTTQESDAAADNAGWLGFLGLIKKHRVRQPINGAMVAISLSDLSMQDEITQMSHAKAIRRRLNELREKLGVRFPVYVLFTKADLIAGFTEFFDPLGKEAREQVWGFTLPLPKAKGEASPVGLFDTEFGALLQRLNAQSLERMQQETDHQRRSLIAGFPGQVASVRQVAKDFLAEIFQDNRFETRHELRGVYFTSGTQEGTPIDRLMMGMARTFGIGRQAIGSGRGSGRSFFLTRLFDGVIFKEAGLVSADDKVERRYRWTKRGAIAAVILIAIGATGLWTRSFLGNQAMIAEASTKLDEYQVAAAAIPPSPVGDTDLVAVVPALNTLRDMPANPALGEFEEPGALKWGLYQGDVLGSQAAQAYRAALNQHFLPRLLLRLEDQMQANLNNADLLYEVLKVYLMLGGDGPMNEDLVREWMALDWSVAYADPSRDQLRADLTDHLNAMLGQPLQKIALNGPLVEQVQGLLLEMPMAERVYNGIVNSPKAAALPEWRLTDVAGPAASRVLVRSSGKPLTEGIEGIYTYNGFKDVFLGEALGVATRIQRDSWVLGPRGESEQSEQALLKISRDVLDLYYNDYIARYDGILGDVDILPLESLSHAVEVTNVLSGPTSPIVNLLNAVADETKLGEERNLATEVAAEGVTDGATQFIGREVRSGMSIQAEALLTALQQSATNAAGTAEPPKMPGVYVQERFQWLHDMVLRPEGAPSQLDEMIVLLNGVYNELNKMSFSGGVATNASPEESALGQFQLAMGRFPGPMQRWATQITSGSSGITADGTRASINARWQSQVLPFCEQALDNRYPFTRAAAADVGAADFAKIFAPNGLIDAFFNENLLKYVDTRARPWTWKKVNSTDLGISEAVLQQMQYAAEIRDAFFAGGAQPAITFQLTPEAMDEKAKAMVLEVDGTQVPYSHKSAPTPVAVTWPGAVGLAQLTFEPALQGIESRIKKDGPWAWFRLLEAAEVRKTNVSDRSRVIFNIGGRIAIFQLQSGSVINPFALPALSKFSCPKSF
ncbi:MAG: type VI secretion system membrane subunit TssM [Pseudomonadota bacterium]